MTYELQVASYELQVTSYELPATSYELGFTVLFSLSLNLVAINCALS
jgi:hypothetical protein